MPTATPQAYFEEALRLLAREGRNGLRIGRLCAALGVTSGSFYHHFGSWEGFVSALLEHWEREETARLVELVNASDDALERVTRMKYLALTVPHEAETAIRAWAHGDERVAVVQARVDQQRRRVVAEALVGAGVDGERADRLADLTLAVLIGQQQRLGPTDVGELLALFDELGALSPTSAAPIAGRGAVPRS
jgi:AcrR family transcriptional regulator